MFHKTKVVVAGATGYIGGNVLKGLCQKGFDVRALARDPERLDPTSGCKDIFVGQATQPDTLRGLCDSADVVFSSIGVHNLARSPTIWEVDYQANINILKNALESGVRHFVFVSTLHGPAMARTSKVARAREAVAQAIIQSGIQYTVFRPAAFFNDMEHLFDTARKHGVIYLPGNPDVQINPLHGLDFADAVADAINDPALSTARSIGGPETLTRYQIAEMAFAALGQPPSIRRLPLWLFTGPAPLIKPFNDNLYAMLKTLEFVLSTPDMTGEPYGDRTIAAFFKELAAREPERPATIRRQSRAPVHR